MGFNIKCPNEDYEGNRNKINMELNLRDSMFHYPN